VSPADHTLLILLLADTSLHVLPPSLRAAQLFATPIPAEYEAQGAKIQKAVEQAVRESVEQGVDKRGKEVTPWLLKRVGELTQGKALESSKSRRMTWVGRDGRSLLHSHRQISRSSRTMPGSAPSWHKSCSA